MLKIFISALCAANAAAPDQTLKIPLQHFASAAVDQISQSYTCYNAKLRIDASAKRGTFRITSLSGFAGNSTDSIRSINDRLAGLGRVVGLHVSCAPESQLVEFDSLSPAGGEHEYVSVYLTKTGVTFFPLA